MSLSPDQKALLRTPSQRNDLGFAVLQPKTVFSCQINDTFTTHDMVLEFIYDNVTTGSYSDVVVGMTMYIGTTAGAYDLGVCRVRKAATSTILYVGETSEIDFDDNLYVTVVREHSLWARHLVTESSSVVYMDGDVEYSDQHTNFDPVPILGGDVVVDVESYPVTITFPKVVDSWVFGDTIASYSFAADEGTVLNGTSTNPSLRIDSYPTNGYIEVALTITTTSGGKSFTGYRYVYVFDTTHRPITDFELETCRVDKGVGGWTLEVTLNDSDDIALTHHRGLAILFTKDYFGGTAGVVGLDVDRENILMSAWIYQHTDTNDIEFAPRKLEVHGAHQWLQKISCFPTGIRLDATASWTDIPALTVSKGLWHLLHWRTTATAVMDIYLNDGDLYTKECSTAAQNIWAQIADIAMSQIVAEPRCSHNKGLYVGRPYNLLSASDRAANSIQVMTLLTSDYVRKNKITWKAPVVGKLLLSGVVVTVQGSGSSLFSLSPGHAPAFEGDWLVLDNLLLEDQSQANSLAGLIFADKINPYEDIPLVFTGANHVFDIAPMMHANISMTQFSGVVTPSWINYSKDSEGGKLVVEIGFEGATIGEALSTNGDIPIGNGEFVTPVPSAYPSTPSYDLTIPDMPTLEFPGLGSVTVDTPCADYISNQFALSWSRTYLQGSDAGKVTAHVYFPCKIRASGSFAPTYIKLNGIWAGDAKTHYHVYGTLGGSQILTATVTNNVNGNIATFAPVSDTTVDGFDIELEEVLGLLVKSGSIDITKNYGTTISPLVAGNLYAIQATPGPFYPYGTMSASTAFNLGITGAAYPDPEGTGTVGYNFLNNGLYMDDVPPGALYTEWVSSQYLRVYFYADLTLINMRAAVYYPWGLNTGSLGYTIYNAGGYGRAIYLKQSTLFNVCAI